MGRRESADVSRPLSQCARSSTLAGAARVAPVARSGTRVGTRCGAPRHFCSVWGTASESERALKAQAANWQAYARRVGMSRSRMVAARHRQNDTRRS